MSPDQVEIFKAVAGAIATILAAVLAVAGVIYAARRPSKQKEPPTDHRGYPLENFQGTQNEFMALVVQDNRSLRDGQEKLNDVLDEQNRVIDELKAMVESIKQHQDSFLFAVRRYLMKLASEWPGPEKMPWPDEEDFHLLEDTLPNRKVHRKE